MGKAIPKIDESVRWLRCRRPGCGASHVPEVDCPPKDTWLVEHFRAIRSPGDRTGHIRRRKP